MGRALGWGLWCGLAALASVAAPAAADIAVVRGSESEVVSTARAGAGVTVLRGTPRADTGSRPGGRTAAATPASSGLVGTGETLWFVDRRGRLRACWLRGTGYVDDLAVVCSR
ncbi:MAG: hypothetical protein ACFCUO_11365 [Rhodospirillales bacterium]